MFCHLSFNLSPIHSFIIYPPYQRPTAPSTASSPNHVILCLLLPFSAFSHFLKVIQLCLRLLLPHVSLPSFFHPISCVRGQFLCKVQPIQLLFIPLYTGCRSLPLISPPLHISCDCFTWSYPSFSSIILKTPKLFLSCFSNSPPFTTYTSNNLPPYYQIIEIFHILQLRW